MKLLSLTISFFFIVNIFSQLTLIPDANFEQVLIDLGHDVGPVDGSVPTLNITSVDSLDVSASSISDLTGVQDFINLSFLNCSYNLLTTLDLTSNTNLVSLICVDNQLTSINITECLNLSFLHCSDNELTSLDITQNTALTTLLCTYNQLTTLDLSQNTVLDTLICFHNELTFLDVSQNSALILLSCPDNQLSSLDVTQNQFLTLLSCSDNQITLLDLSYNTDLRSLDCSNNDLKSLDISENSFLTHLQCVNNSQLECLNVSNGNNINFTSMKANYNPNLTCITVDDPTWSTANWTGNWFLIDSQTSYDDNCGDSCTLNIHENIFKSSKNLYKIVDITGREIQFKKNTLMIYIYEDGSSEKIFVFE